jgi:hypothetical protein
MRNIRIDDELYAFLQRHARPFEDSENDVLRRLLLEDGGDTRPRKRGLTAAPSPGRRPGNLMPYLDAGLLRTGDELVHEQPRKGLVHRATVSADGWLLAQDESFAEVSPALKHCVGHEINGWKYWTHRRSGQPLRALRDELHHRQSASGKRA